MLFCSSSMAAFGWSLHLSSPRAAAAPTNSNTHQRGAEDTRGRSDQRRCCWCVCCWLTSLLLLSCCVLLCVFLFVLRRFALLSSPLFPFVFSLFRLKVTGGETIRDRINLTNHTWRKETQTTNNQHNNNKTRMQAWKERGSSMIRVLLLGCMRP